MLSVNHINEGVAEANTFDSQMLSGFFLYEKEHSYKATVSFGSWRGETSLVPTP